MLIMGYLISERAQKIARDAIASRRGSFSAGHIAREIKPLITQTKEPWRGATVSVAALAAAEALIWEKYRAGLVKPTGTWLGRKYWRACKQDGRAAR